MTPRVIAPGRTLRGAVRVPGSKSVTQRYMNLALIAGRRGGDWRLEWPLRSDDTRHFGSGLEAAGFAVDWRGADDAGSLVLKAGAASRSGGEIFCGHGGTMMRFLVAAMATQPGADWVLDGSPRLRQRPIGPLIDALRELGAGIDCLGVEGFPPVRVRGGSLEGGRARLDAGESSQYLSAILMAGLGARRAIELDVEALASAPYVDLTVQAIEQVGGRVEHRGAFWRVEPATLAGGTLEVEGDWSAASYWLAGAPLTGGEIRLQGLVPDSKQGDRRFVAVVERLGGEVEWRGRDLLVRGSGALRGLDVDLSKMPDLVPTVAAVAPFADGTTRISNVAHLRIKESDRLAAMRCELDRVGAKVSEQEDGLVIEGSWADPRSGDPPREPVTIDAHDDHRIAMSLALTALRRPGISIAEPGVVEKSYPSFWRHFDTLAG